MADPAIESKLDAMLNENSVRLNKVIGSVQLGDAVMIRHFPCSDDSLLALAKARLDTIKYYDIPPTQNKEEWAGRWRVISNEIVSLPDYGGKQGIMQTLGYGYFTSLVWTSARIATGEERDTANVSVADGKAMHLMVDFKFIAPANADEIAVALRDGSPWSDIVIQGVTHAGPLYCLLALPKLEDDGSYTVTAILSQPHGVFIGWADYGSTNSQVVTKLLHVPAKIVQSQATALKLAGTTLDPSYSQSENTWDLTVRTMSLEEYTTAEAYGFTEDMFSRQSQRPFFNMSTFPSIGDFVAGIIVSVQARMNLWKRWEGTTTIETAKTHTEPDHSVSEDAFESEKERPQFNVAAVPSLSAFAAGVIEIIKAKLNKFQKWDVEITTQTAKEVTGSEEVVQEDAFESVSETQRVNSSIAPEAPSFLSGILYSISRKLNRYMLWDSSTNKTTAKEVVSSSHTVLNDAMQSAEEVEHINVASVPSIASRAVGVWKQASFQLNKFNLWAGSIVSTTAKAGSKIFTITSENMQFEHEIYWNQPNTSAMKTGDAAHHLTLAKAPTMNRDGTWDWYTISSPRYDEWTEGEWQQEDVQYSFMTDPADGIDKWMKKVTTAHTHRYIVASCTDAYGGTWATGGEAQAEPHYLGDGRWAKDITTFTQTLWTPTADIAP